MQSGDICVIVVSVILAFALASTPLLARADTPAGDPRNRISSLDGLRGILALAVLLHHGAIYRSYLSTGVWAPVGNVNTMLGQGGVAMFFMLTGYLFWRRLISAEGQIDWPHFFVSRVFRIGPVYLLATGAALLATLALTRQLNVPLPSLAWQGLQWLLLGATPAVSVNGYDTPLLLAGVTWSLNYEWLFYASLPLVALLTRYDRAHLPAACAILVTSIVVLYFRPAPIEGSLASYVALFGAGMVSGSLQKLGVVPARHGRLTSCLAVALAAGSVGLCSTAYAPAAILSLGALFYLIATGCSVFGILQTRAARRLGNISYDIYVLQGLVLALILRPEPMRLISIGSPVGHWALVTLAGGLLLLVATASHAWLERPCIAMGERFARALAGRIQMLKAASFPVFEPIRQIGPF